MDDHNNFLESNGDEEIGRKEDQKLESAKGEIGEVREENKRLNFLFVYNYQAMQRNFFDILQQDKPKEDTKVASVATNHEESELVSLSLGISSQGQPSMDEKKNSNENREDENVDKGLTLGLDIKFNPVAQIEATNNPSSESSLDEKGKEEVPAEMWPPSKVFKTMKIRDKSEASQHTQLKKARVSIRARCESQTMNDGCQWRKYGQKIAKRNLCPRAYYRCTVSTSCPVQRCAEDMSILTTTYEGIHNHPLPISATAMASTTSAAVSMLQSPSLSSQLGLSTSNIAPIINSSAAYNPNAINFSTHKISRPHQFYFPNSTISTLNSHPTITLDLTASPNSSNSGNFTHIPKYSSTNLNFSSSGFSPLQSSMPLPQSPRSSFGANYFNCGTGILTQIINQGGYLLNSGKQPSHEEHLHYQQIYMNNHTISQQSLTDSIVAAATKSITTNPRFQSVLANSFTTYVGNGAGDCGWLRQNHIALESAQLNLNGGDVSFTCSQNSIGCASSRYLNMSSSALNSQQGNSTVFQPLPSGSKSTSGSSSS